jgi:hypothetical protein
LSAGCVPFELVANAALLWRDNCGGRGKIVFSSDVTLWLLPSFFFDWHKILKIKKLVFETKKSTYFELSQNLFVKWNGKGTLPRQKGVI